MSVVRAASPRARAHVVEVVPRRRLDVLPLEGRDRRRERSVPGAEQALCEVGDTNELARAVHLGVRGEDLLDQGGARAGHPHDEDGPGGRVPPSPHPVEPRFAEPGLDVLHQALLPPGIERNVSPEDLVPPPEVLEREVVLAEIVVHLAEGEVHVAALRAGGRVRVKAPRRRRRLLDLRAIRRTETPGLRVVEPDVGMVRAPVDDPAVAARRRLELARVDVGQAELGQRVRVIRGQGERPFVLVDGFAGAPGVEQRAAETDPEIGVLGKPLDESPELGDRGLRLARSAERAAEVEAGVDMARIEREGGPKDGHRIPGPLPLEEQVPEGGVRGGLLRLARDRPPREIESEPEPAGRPREKGVVQRRAGKLRRGREHLAIARLGGGEPPGSMVHGSLPEALGKSGRRLRPKAAARRRTLARLGAAGSACHRCESRPGRARSFPDRMVSDALLRMTRARLVIIRPPAAAPPAQVRDAGAP